MEETKGTLGRVAQENIVLALYNHYRKHQDEYVALYAGKHLVLHEMQVKGAFENEIEAFDFAMNNFQLGSFMVQRCSAGSEDYTVRVHGSSMRLKTGMLNPWFVSSSHFTTVPIIVESSANSSHYSCKAAWDPDSVGTKISTRVTEILQLPPSTQQKIRGGNGLEMRPTFLVAIGFSPNLKFADLRVASLEGFPAEYDVIIGTDIMGQLDFCTIHSS